MQIFLSPLFCFFLLLGSSQLAAQDFFEARAVREDLFFLQKALYRGHPGVFRYQTQTGLDALFDSLRAALPDGKITQLQAHSAIQCAVAAVRDGHTSVLTPFYDEETKVLPLAIQTDAKGRVFVWRNYSADTSLRRGTEISHVANKPVQEHIAAMTPLFFGDGFNTSFGDALAPVYFARYLYLLQGPSDSLTVASTKDGAMRNHQLATKSRAVIQKMQELRQNNTPRKPGPAPVLRNGRSVALFRDTLHSKTAILKMGSFPNRRFPRFYRNMFDWLDDNGMENLVIDLRYNTGGNIRNMDRLVSYIADSTFGYDYMRKRNTRMGPYFGPKAKITKVFIWLKYNLQPGFKYRRENGQHVQRWRVKPHKRDHFDGKVFVLTNGWSFSSASMCASFLKNTAGAIIVGTETGGGESGNCGGGFPTLRLPNTRFKIRFPLFWIRYRHGKPNTGRGVMPHVPVQYSILDYLQEKDLEMEAVRRMIGG